MLAQPSGFRPELPDLFYQNNIKGWGPALCAPADVTMDMVHDFLTNMYTKRADFVFTVTRDFVRACQTPILVLPDDVPGAPVRRGHGDRASGAEGRGEHLPLESIQGPDSAGGAPGARLTPGASPRDRPLRPAVWRRSAACSSPRREDGRSGTGGNGRRAWRARTWLRGAAITVTMRAVPSPEEVSGWHSRTMLRVD